MHALDYVLFPELFKGAGPFTDRDDRQPYTKEHFVECHQIYSQAIRLVQDWDSGKFIMTFTDYKRTPALLFDIRNIYRYYLKEYGK